MVENRLIKKRGKTLSLGLSFLKRNVWVSFSNTMGCLFSQRNARLLFSNAMGGKLLSKRSRVHVQPWKLLRRGGILGWEFC